MCNYCLSYANGVAGMTAEGSQPIDLWSANAASTAVEGTVIGGISNSGVQNINALIYGTRWQNGSTVSYGFPDSFADYGAYAHTISGFEQANLMQRTATRLILEGPAGIQGLATQGTVFRYGSYASVANITLDEVAGFNAADISVANTNLFDGANLPTARVADFPRLDQRSDGGDVWFGNDYASYKTPRPGSYAWLTFVHEFGHAVGLKHGHQDNHGTFLTALTPDRDSMEFSVMTYRSYVGGPTTGYTNETYGYAQTLMMYDIATLQHLYGANFTTNNSDTVYKWNPTTGEMSVNGVGQGAPGEGNGGSSNRVFMTIWDGGGEDTYDASDYTTPVVINLDPGGWSTLSETQLANLGNGNKARANVFNALQYNNDPRSLIEHANGGSGDDQITGNAVGNRLMGNAGNDSINGLGGNDMIFGGDGNDTLYGGGGIDTLYGEAGNDVLISYGSSSTVLDGGLGNDTIYGGAGNDYMIGGDGNDVIVGLGGIDSLYGGAGDDYLVSGDGPNAVLDGGAGTNSLWGGNGNDYAIGGEGNDTIATGGGSDYIFGLAGNDSIYAGGGTDYIYSNEGNDFIYTDDIGQQFKDYVYVGFGTGVDTVADFTASGVNADVVVITGGIFTSFAQVQNHMTQVGVYTVISMSANDQLYLYNIQPSQLSANNFILL